MKLKSNHSSHLGSHIIIACAMLSFQFSVYTFLPAIVYLDILVRSLCLHKSFGLVTSSSIAKHIQN